MLKFRELRELWRADNSLTQALNISFAMLEVTAHMYGEAVRSLRHSDDGKTGAGVYEQDQIVNRYQQEMRAKILKHLTLATRVDITPGLVLTSTVIDLERIGDYTKNIMDLAIALPRPLVCGTYEDDLVRMEGCVHETFQLIAPILVDMDKVAARELIDANYWMIKRCDEIIEGLVREVDASLGSGDAVATAMYVRYLKRIEAHLLNVASSVVNPFERIGYRAE